MNNEAQCEPCPENTYQRVDRNDKDVCRDCPDGYSTNGLVGQTVCERKLSYNFKPT